MIKINQIFINANKRFLVSATIDDVDYSADNVDSLLKSIPGTTGDEIDALVELTKVGYAGEDGVPFEFHGICMSKVDTSMLYLTLSGKVILLRESYPYEGEVVSESDPQRYSYQIYDKMVYQGTFEYWLRDTTASTADYINMCKQLGISYVKNLD